MKISNTNISSKILVWVSFWNPGTSVAAAGKKILEVLLAAHEE
jgi:hypothetical protein